MPTGRTRADGCKDRRIGASEQAFAVRGPQRSRGWEMPIHTRQGRNTPTRRHAALALKGSTVYRCGAVLGTLFEGPLLHQGNTVHPPLKGPFP